jgi:hypothetical protein
MFRDRDSCCDRRQVFRETRTHAQPRRGFLLPDRLHWDRPHGLGSENGFQSLQLLATFTSVPMLNQ